MQSIRYFFYVNIVSLLHHQLLVFLLQHIHLHPKFLDIISFDQDLFLLRVIEFISTSGETSCLLCTVCSSYKFFSLLDLLRYNLELLSSTKLTELSLPLSSDPSKLLNVLQQLLIVVHNVVVVLLMDRFLFLQSLFQSFHRIVQEFPLSFSFLFDITIFDDIFDLSFLHIFVEMLINGVFELLIIIDVLSNPVHGIFVLTNVALVSTHRISCKFYTFLHVLLPCSEILNHKAKRCIDCVIRSKFAIFFICLQLKIRCLHFFWSDIFLELFDFIVQYEFELLKLLSFLLQMVNLRLSISDGLVFLLDLLRQFVNFSPVSQDESFLFFNKVVELSTFVLFLFIFLYDIMESILHKLEFSFTLECHILNLSDILFVFLFNVLEFFLSIILNLFHRHLVSVHSLINIFLLLIDLSLFVLHLFAVLLLFKAHVCFMLLHNFLKRSFKVLSFLFFLSLKLLESLSIIKHFRSILLSFLFDDILLAI